MKAWSFKPFLLGIGVGLALGVLVYLAWLARPQTLQPENRPPGNVPSGWLTMTDSETGATFRYPEDLGTNYIHTQDWPPQVQILDQRYTCTEGGTSEALPAGQTTAQTVNGHDYCVTRETEGAAGSIYTQYAYAFAADDGTAILTFTTRSVQCANYDDPQKTECQNERDSFDVNGIADQMAQSLQL